MAVRDRSTAPVLDDAAKAIIEQLQQDGRRPYASIGKAVGLSEAAVRQRVQRLQDAGIMQIVAVTDPMQMGFSRAAMIGIQVEGDVEAVAEIIEAMVEVDYLVVTDPKLGVARPGAGRALVAVHVGATRLLDNMACTVAGP